jgi:hypothetical protein
VEGAVIQPTHAELAARLDKGAAQFVEINKQLAEIASKLEVLPEMQRDIAATKELVEAWGAVKLAGRFIKWASGLIGGLAVLWAAIKIGLGAVR